MIDHKQTMVTPDIEVRVCIACSSLPWLIDSPALWGLACRPSRGHLAPTLGTRELRKRRIIPIVPRTARLGFEPLSCFLAGVVLKSAVVDRSVDGLPRQSCGPELVLSGSDAVREKASWIQHISMPDQDNV